MGLTKVTYSMIEGAPLNILDFGAVGDGSTDNYAAFTAAFAAAEGKKLFIPSGTYNIEFTGITGLNTPADVIIEGEGINNTIINFVPSSTSYRNLIVISENMVVFRDLAITADIPTNGQVSFVLLNASNVSFESCKLDGGVTNVGSTLSHTAYGLNYPSSGTQDNLYIDKTTFTQLTYPFLKDNANTSLQNHIVVTNSVFTENYYNDLGLNSPNGAINNVVITNNRFVANRTVASVGPTQALGVALASVSNFSISNNVFEGVYTDAIHIEENSVIGSVTANTFSVDGTAISFNGNNKNSGAVVYSPTNISVTGNSMYKSGTAKEAGKYGIRFIYNGASDLPGKYISISDNTIYNYEIGFYSVVDSKYAISFTDNLIRGCAYGIQVRESGLTISGNTTVSCDVGVGNTVNAYQTNTGIVNEHTFIDCTVNVDARYKPYTLNNPKFIFSPFALAASGTAYKVCLPSGASDRYYGVMEISAMSETSIAWYSNRATTVKWDGATFTGTNQVYIEDASLVTSVFGSTNLGVQLNNTNVSTSLTAVYLEVKLNGMAVVAA